MELSGIFEGLAVILIWEVIRRIFGERAKKMLPSSLSDSISQVRKKVGRLTCTFLGHVFERKEVHYPVIHGFHIYSECAVCGLKKDEDTIPYEEMVRRNKSKGGSSEQD